MNWPRFIELSALLVVWSLTWAISYSIVNLIVMAMNWPISFSDELVAGFLLPLFGFGVFRFCYFDKHCG